MPKKIPRKANTSFTRTSNKGKQALFKSQQKTSTPKKIQNDKTLKSTNYKSTLKLSCKIPNDRISLFEDKVISSNSSDSENQESDEHEFNKDESREKDEDIIMQDVKSTSSEEEDSTESSDNENMKKINYSEETEESEEENSNVGNVDEKELGDKTEDDMDEIIEDTTKISLKKKGKDKEEIKSQYETTTTEAKDPIPIPLLARPQAEKQFRDYYMNQITKAFGEDLDKLRKKEASLSSNKLEILIDSLESGISIFSDTEKELALLSSNTNNLS